MSANDGYQPTEIVDQPIPLLGGNFSNSTGSATNPIANADAESPNTLQNNSLPVGIVAADVISTSLNTETKQIKGNFAFEQMGAITIGQISISPVGILGVDLSGNTTFALDPNTGSAYFKGTVAAGSIVTGYIVVGGAAGDINGNVTTIDGGKITANSITANKIVAGSLIVGTNVGLGTAQDSTGVTTIIGNTVTTGYINALSITAQSLSGGTIDIGGSDNTSFHVDSGGNLWLGAATYGSAPFVIASNGELATVNGIDVSGGLSVDYALFSTQSNKTNDGAFWLFASGGNRFWRSRANGFNGQFDQHGF